MIRRTVLFFLIASFCVALYSFTDSATPKTASKQKIIRTLVIDAGHGKQDNGGYHGAKGSYSYEDQICLAVSKELVAMVKREYPEIRIVETRPTERFVANYRRAEIANENKGDLFVCIHVNSAPAKKHSQLTGYKNVTTYVGKGKKKKKVTKKVPQYRYWTTANPAKGTETYIWGAHKNEDKEVAMRENASMMQEENFEANYGAIDPNSPEFIALSLIKTKQYFKRSATLAGFVQDEFARVGRVDRDVRQRPVGIWVLQATAMPSILVETGFISNPEDERYLNSKEGQKEIADCITRAIGTYITWLEKHANVGDNFHAEAPESQGTPRAFLDMVDEKEKKAR